MAMPDARHKVWPYSALYKEIELANGPKRMVDVMQTELRAAMDSLIEEYRDQWEKALPGCMEALGMRESWKSDGQNYMRWVQSYDQAMSMADEIVLEEMRPRAREVRLVTSIAWDKWDKYQRGEWPFKFSTPKRPDFPRPTPA